VFGRAASREPDGEGLPERSVPTPEQQEALAALATAHGIELVGPPLA